jgi:Peptidase family M28
MSPLRSTRFGSANLLILAAAVLSGTASLCVAQTAPRARAASAPAPWFGVPLPPKLGGVPAVLVGPRGVRPAIVPSGEPKSPELEGASIRADLDTIVSFSKESRTSHEIGNGQLWGRVTGFPSSSKTINWTADQFRKAGIKDVRIQPMTQDPQARFFLPTSWELKLLGDASYGPGSSDVVLESAMPVGSDIPGGTLTAPLVLVGSANPSFAPLIDVKGKIAVQVVVPQAHMVFDRASVSPRSQDLMKRGAVAVLTVLRHPGNEYAKDLGGCGGPCFNVGGRDGFFLERVLDRAATAGAPGVRAQLKMTSETKTNLRAENAVAIIPGRSQDVIVLDAHADAWFDGAGDNGDGLAVLVALARHFAKPENRPDRTLVLIASAGHHTAGLNGPRGFVAANPDLAKRAVLVVNIEHVAQRNFGPGRSVAADGYRDFVADSGEAPITAGVTNQSPYLNELFQQGVARYGTNFVSEPSPMLSGETGGFTSMDVALVTIMQAPPLYHTTGETLDVISTPGLERMARFLAFFVKQTGKASATAINPPGRTKRPVEADDR